MKDFVPFKFTLPPTNVAPVRRYLEDQFRLKGAFCEVLR